MLQISCLSINKLELLQLEERQCLLYNVVYSMCEMFHMNTLELRLPSWMLSKVVVNSAINRCAKGGAWLVAIKLLHGTDCTPDVISDLANF